MRVPQGLTPVQVVVMVGMGVLLLKARVHTMAVVAVEPVVILAVVVVVVAVVANQMVILALGALAGAVELLGMEFL